MPIYDVIVYNEYHKLERTIAFIYGGFVTVKIIIMHALWFEWGAA